MKIVYLIIFQKYLGLQYNYSLPKDMLLIIKLIGHPISALNKMQNNQNKINVYILKIFHPLVQFDYNKLDKRFYQSYFFEKICQSFFGFLLFERVHNFLLFFEFYQTTHSLKYLSSNYNKLKQVLPAVWLMNYNL